MKQTIIFMQFLAFANVQAADTLVTRLTSTDRQVQAKASNDFETLRKSGNTKKIEELVPQLIPLLQSKVDTTCNIAAYYLAQLGHVAKEAVPSFAQVILESEGCTNVYEHFGKFKEDIAPAIPRMLEVLSSVTDEDIDRQDGPGIRILRALTNSGSYAKAAIPQLKMEIEKRQSVFYFCSALVSIDPHEGLPYVTRYIKSGEKGVDWEWWILLAEQAKKDLNSLTPEARAYYEQHKNNPPISQY